MSSNDSHPGYSRSSMAHSLAELCRNRLCRTNYSVPDLARVPRFPLPSTLETILASLPTKLPFAMVDEIMDDLSTRGKLTSNVLAMLMESKITRLKLACLRSMDENETRFLSLLANQHHVVDIDLSFSPCFGKMSVPFVRALSQSCKDSLVSFSASFVRGDVGFECLRDFSSLRHLDVSFTSVTSRVLGDVCNSLKGLTHLDVSGTMLTWRNAFSLATNVSNLQHLGMSHLKFLEEEQKVLFEWMKGFFDRVQTLTSLDVSSVEGITRSVTRALTQAMDTILVSSPKSLTRLIISWWFSNDVLHQLDVRRDTLETVLFVESRKLHCFWDGYWNPSVVLSYQIVVVLRSSSPSYLFDQIRKNSDVPFILSKGLSYLNRIDLVFGLANVVDTLSYLRRGENFSKYFKRVLECTVFACQCYISTDGTFAAHSLRSLLCSLFYFKTQLKQDGCWNELEQVWQMFLEALLEPRIFRLHENSGWNAFHLPYALLMEMELDVVSKPSLIHACTVLLVNMLQSSSTRWIVYYENKYPIAVILEAFLNSLSKEQKTGFVLVNNWTVLLSKFLLQYIADVLEEKRHFREYYWHFLDNQLFVRFNVLRLISAGIPVVQEQLVDNGAVSSDIQEFVFSDVPYCKKANESLIELLTSLAETSRLRESLLTSSLLGVLSRKQQRVSLSKSYLSCLLLLSKVSSSKTSQFSLCSEEEFAFRAVHCYRKFSESAVDYAKRNFAMSSLKEMSQFRITRVSLFGRKCLAVLQQ